MRYTPFKSILKRGVCVTLILVMLLGQTVFSAASEEDENNQDYLQGIINMIREDYYTATTEAQLNQGAIKGMLGVLDPYTTYYTPKEADSFLSSVTGVFGGIGVTIEASGDYVTVTKVLPGTPAQVAGILQGDKLVEADGKSLLKLTADDAANLIRGAVGTKVKIGILRGSSSTVKYFEIGREIIKVNPVTYEIRNGIGYIRLESFNENSDEYITKALAEMDKNKITKLVLDLRDNPGGEVGQAVQLAKKFVPSGLITKLDYKSEKYQDIEYRSDLIQPKYKLAVLVNGNSASASEIVAGAIQDSGVGKLVGTKTFGKAKFQVILPILTKDAFVKYSKQTGINTVNAYDLQTKYNIFPGKDEIAGYTKMTLGLYYTPKGRMIDEKGLTPDVLAADPKPVSNVNVINIQKLTGTETIALNGMGIDVYYAEAILKALGYLSDEPDTKFDAKSVSAVKVYQKARKLTTTGTLDNSTRNMLNTELDKLILKYDTQYSAAVQSLK